MMDKEFAPAPLDDQDLNALFEAAQRDTPELDPEFLMRLQAQAAAAVPQSAPQTATAPVVSKALWGRGAIWRLAGRGGLGHGRGGRGGHRYQPTGCSVGHHQRLFPNRKPQRAYRHRV